MRRTSSFTERDILRNCGHASFHDGARDLAAGRVREIECDGDKTIEGDVESRTGKTAYSVTVAVEKGRTGTVITGHCTCPDRTNCRHVAAVLLGAFRGTVLRAPPPPPPTPETRAARLLQFQDSTGPEALPSELESWIRTLDRARRTGSEAFPPEIDRRLIYVLLALPGHGGTAPRLGVAPMQARILKSGALSAKARPVEPSAIVHAGTPSAYLRPSDLRILKSLAGRPREAEADAPPAYSLLDEAGAEILERVLATGRARSGPCSPSPARACSASAAPSRGTGARRSRSTATPSAAVCWHGGSGRSCCAGPRRRSPATCRPRPRSPRRSRWARPSAPSTTRSASRCMPGCRRRSPPRAGSAAASSSSTPS